MTRSYSNFLLFENVLDTLSSAPDPIIAQSVSILLNPITKIVEEDCGTLLGEQVDTTYEIEGLLEVATGATITHSRINTLLAQGQYRTGVRNLHTCLSHTSGGICRKCYSGSFLFQTAPIVGTNLSIKSNVIYQTDIVRGTGFTTNFPLSQKSDEYYDLKVINQGVLVSPSTYTLDATSITFTTIPPNDPVTGVYTIHFYDQSASAFQGLISKTYTGGLLGMSPLPTIKTMLRPDLYESQFSDGFTTILVGIVSKLSNIPKTHVEYISRIHSRTEKVIYVLYLYALYGVVKL